jgi:peptide/nickel transport system substrate-binding protein
MHRSARPRPFARFSTLLAAATLALFATAHAQDATLRVATADLPTTLEPGIETSNTGVRIIPSVFETLLEMDPADNSVLRPKLASAWRRVDDLTLEFDLRQDVVFHDGTPFTSADVVYSIERILDPEFPGSLTRSLLSTIASVEARGDHTVRITTAEPDPILDYRLASQWGSWIVPAGAHAALGTDAFGRAPVGTGPFRLVEYTPDLVRLERFDGYWGEAPVVDAVSFRAIPETAARTTALANAEVDLITQVPPDQAAVLATRPGVLIKSTLIDNIHLHIYNVRMAPTDDPLVRRALRLAIDRDLLVETLWSGLAEVPRGHQYPAYGPLYDDERPYAPYDPEEARRLLAEAGYAGEVIYYDTTGTYYVNELPAAEAIVQMWQDVGLNAQVRVVDRSQRTYENAHVITWSNTMRFPDPLGGLWLLWGPSGGQQGERWAPTSRFNEVGAAMANELDRTRRGELALELLDLWEEETPGTVLWYPSETYAMRDHVVWTPDRSHAMDFRPHLFQLR